MYARYITYIVMLIQTTNGKPFKINNKDAPEFMKYDWRWRGKYATGYKKLEYGYKMIDAHILTAKLHNLKVDNGQCVDHIDGNTSNNTLDNLRVIPKTINSMKKHKAGKLYRGIDYIKKSNKWRVRINYKYVGLYNTITEAIEEYNKQLKEFLIQVNLMSYFDELELCEK